MENLKSEDYTYFRTKGFEVVKETGGRYYVRPTGDFWSDFTNIHENLLKAKQAAIQCGFSFDLNGYILRYQKLDNG